VEFTRPPVPPSIRLRRRVAWTFPIAFALHDLEEVLTAGRWQATAEDVVRRRFGTVPPGLRRLLDVSPRQMTIAVGVVGVGVGAASAVALADLRRAARTGPVEPAAGLGAQRLFRAVLMAYSAHGLTHLASSVLLRAYTPGVVTVPLVIAPYSVWAWRTLLHAGVPLKPREVLQDLLFGAPMAVAFVGGGQLIGRTVDLALRQAGR
jgi:hypothetical protein